MPAHEPVCVVWLRRDLRLKDHGPLSIASHSGARVIPVFVVDDATIEPFNPGRKPHAYFFGALLSLRAELRRHGKDLILLQGKSKEEIPRFCQTVGASALYFGKDYEPAARARDAHVAESVRRLGLEVHAIKDQVLNEENEVLSGSGTPYRIYTPYKNAALSRLDAHPPRRFPDVVLDRLVDREELPADAPGVENRLQDLIVQGQQEARGTLEVPGEAAAHARLDEFLENALGRYHAQRNLPAVVGTSRLSGDLRTGALSPRQVWTETLTRAKGVPIADRDLFLSELLWRDFFMMVGFHFPGVFTGPFNTKYSEIRWRNDRAEFRAWCEGRTGYPIVDAGMRELVATGRMHNRVRMITAMFLTKDLLIDWRWGEKFFLEHLIDGDRAVNNGNWQWSASTGTDAQPYFRIFNPTEQSRKFDPEGEYIRHWVPELARLPAKQIHEPARLGPLLAGGYPEPIVDHKMARLRTLEAYKRAQ